MINDPPSQIFFPKICPPKKIHTSKIVIIFMDSLFLEKNMEK
jgi:hypothetical protein